MTRPRRFIARLPSPPAMLILPRARGIAERDVVRRDLSSLVVFGPGGRLPRYVSPCSRGNANSSFEIERYSIAKASL
jgi:hypothetical protein